MRFALLATASTLLVGFATFACSGSASDGTDTTAADAGASTAVNDTTSGTGTTTTTTTTTATTTDAGADDAAVPTTGGSTAGDGGVACAEDSIRETESNNDTATANVLPSTTGGFCGRLTNGDVDVVRFVMPQTIRSFGASFDQLAGRGGFDIAADVNGQSFDFRGRWPFVAGGTYTFTLTGNVAAGDELDYDLRLVFNP